MVETIFSDLGPLSQRRKAFWRVVLIQFLDQWDPQFRGVTLTVGLDVQNQEGRGPCCTHTPPTGGLPVGGERQARTMIN